MRDSLVRVLEKVSATQTTQANGPTIAVTSEGEHRTNSVRAPQQYSPPAISLVFDKEENRRIGDVYNLVKPLTADWTFDDTSLNTNKSLETIQIMDIASDRTVSECAPIKKIECEPFTTKGASSHNFSEKVLVKDKIDSIDRTDLNIPKNYSIGLVPALDGFPFSQKDCNTLKSIPKNESSNYHVDNVIAKNSSPNITGGIIPNEQNNSVAESIPFKNICSGRIVPTNTCIVENTMKNPKVIKDKKITERPEIGCLDNIMSKLANFKNADEIPRIEKSATNTIVGKSSSSHTESIRNVTKISANENKESSCNGAEETFSQIHSDHVGENILVKTSRSQLIVLTETCLDAQIESRVREYLSIRNNVVMNSAPNVSESVPKKKG